MPSLKMLKKDFVDVYQHRTCIKGGGVMESFVPIKPKDITSYGSKNLEFMLFHQRDTKSANRRNERSNLIRHRGEVESY
jgi:hypothetical protein